MIKQIAICDKCGKQINPYTESNKIVVKYDDKHFANSMAIHLCDKCRKEFMKIYLHENN